MEDCSRVWYPLTDIGSMDGRYPFPGWILSKEIVSVGSKAALNARLAYGDDIKDMEPDRHASLRPRRTPFIRRLLPTLRWTVTNSALLHPHPLSLFLEKYTLRGSSKGGGIIWYQAEAKHTCCHRPPHNLFIFSTIDPPNVVIRLQTNN